MKIQTASSFIAYSLSCLLSINVRAVEPGGKDLDAAIKNGDFTEYFAGISAWLEQKTPSDPAKITEGAMSELIKDPVFRSAVDHRQFIVKLGVTNMNAFAGSAANRTFLSWVMNSTSLMDTYLEAAAPGKDKERESNTYGIDIASLVRWKQLYTEDPDTREGMYLRLAMAAALWPPGGVGQYRGDEHIDWMKRYKNFKTAYQNKELVPSFDHLPVCDYGKVLNCIGADTDIDWARKMIQTWRPDLLEKEQVNKIVSEVWRRFSPFGFTNGFITVMEGGGKCGPRGIFGQFVCNALGIPAIGVGQPAHCCFAARCDYPEEEPQAGSAWKVYQGRGWHVSDCGGGMYGPEFLAEMTKRYRTAEFSQVEHLRWLASALSSKDRADAIRALAVKIRKPVNTSDPFGVPASEIDVVLSGKVSKTARPKEEKEMDYNKEGPPPTNGTLVTALTPARVKEEPFAAVAGVIHVEAETFTNSFAEPMYPAEQAGRVYIYDCYTGGKQVNFQRNMKISWLDYPIDVPEDGTYSMEMMLAAANRDQVLEVSCGDEKLGTVKIPGTTGLWRKMEPVDMKLKKGTQTIRITSPGNQRGIAIRWFELKKK